MSKLLTLLRSIWAVFAGYLVLAVLVMLLLVLALALVPAWQDQITGAYLAVNIALSILSSVCGGWVTAQLAPGHRFQHGLALGLLAAVFGILYAMGPQPEGGMPQPPEWYRLLLACLALPSVLTGSLLRIRQDRPVDELPGDITQSPDG